MNNEATEAEGLTEDEEIELRKQLRGGRANRAAREFATQFSPRR